MKHAGCAGGGGAGGGARAELVRRGLVVTPERELAGRIVVAMLRGAGPRESWPDPAVLAAYAVDVAHEIVDRTAVEPVLVEAAPEGVP